MKNETKNALDKLADEKRDLETAILASLSEILHEFENKTSVSVKGVHIEFIETTVFGDRRRKYALANVSTELEVL